jgi:hypothetical protein
MIVNITAERDALKEKMKFREEDPGTYPALRAENERLRSAFEHQDAIEILKRATLASDRAALVRLARQLAATPNLGERVHRLIVSLFETLPSALRDEVRGK